MPAGIAAGIDRNRYHRHIGRRKQPQQRYPDAMVDAAPVVELRGKSSFCQMGAQFFSESGCAGCRILDRIEFGWKSAKVVNGLRVRMRSQRWSGCVVMRRGDEHRARSRQSRADRVPCGSGSIFLHCKQRRAVGKEQHRLPNDIGFHHGSKLGAGHMNCHGASVQTGLACTPLRREIGDTRGPRILRNDACTSKPSCPRSAPPSLR